MSNDKEEVFICGVCGSKAFDNPFACIENNCQVENGCEIGKYIGMEEFLKSPNAETLKKHIDTFAIKING